MPAEKTRPPLGTINLDPMLRALMHKHGYMHESEVEHISSTHPRTRSRWNHLRGVMFGNEKWYSIDHIVRVLEERQDETEELAVL